MSALGSPVVSEQLLPVTDQQLQGEESSTDLVENKWSYRKAVLYAVAASLILWTGVILAISRIF